MVTYKRSLVHEVKSDSNELTLRSYGVRDVSEPNIEPYAKTEANLYRYSRCELSWHRIFNKLHGIG